MRKMVHIAVYFIMATNNDTPGLLELKWLPWHDSVHSTVLIYTVLHLIE